MERAAFEKIKGQITDAISTMDLTPDEAAEIGADAVAKLQARRAGDTYVPPSLVPHAGNSDKQVPAGVLPPGLERYAKELSLPK